MKGFFVSAVMPLTMWPRNMSLLASLLLLVVLVAAPWQRAAAGLPVVSIAALSTQVIDGVETSFTLLAVTEGTAATFTLTRTGATDAALTVDVSVSESGATVSGTAPTSVTFVAGSSTATLSAATEDDEVAEDSSTLTAAVSSGTGYTVDGTSGSADVVVNDDDAAPVVTTASPIEAAENGTAVATLAATDADTAAGDLSWSIPEGDAGGADASKFSLTAAGVLTFKAAKDFEAPDDANTDGDYEVTVRVTDGSNPVDAALVVRLTDMDEAPPTLSSATVNGDAMTLTFSEALDEGSTPPVTSFTVTVTGSERATAGHTTNRTVTGVSLSGSTVRLSLPLTVIRSETVTVSYTAPTGARATPLKDTAGNAAAGFTDSSVTNRTPRPRPAVLGHNTCGDTGDHASRCNDPAGVMITASDAVTTEGDSVTLDFVVTLSHAYPLEADILMRRLLGIPEDPTDVVTMDYEIETGTHTGAAVAGTDYTDTSGSLSFASGETTKTISVSVLNDMVSEGIETLYLKLTNASKATFVKYGRAQPLVSAKGTILPDEDTTAPTATISTSSELASPVNGWFWVFINFSEPVKGLEASDVEITNGTLVEFPTHDRFIKYGRHEWSAKVVPTPGLTGNVTVKVPAGAVTDLLGNTNTASNTLEISARGATPQGPKPLVLCENGPDPTSWKIHGHIDVTDNVYVRFGFPDPEDPHNGDLVLLPKSSELHVSGIAITDEHGVRAGGSIMACWIPGDGDKKVCRINQRTSEGFSGTLKLQVLAGAITDTSGLVSRASDPLYVAGNPWTVSVADATATRGTDASIEFEVSLNGRDDCRRVTVDWTTVDGTAVAGTDYTSSSGTLTFEPGETTKTVSVPLVSASTSTGDKTLSLMLSNVTGHLAGLGSTEAAGTIASGALPVVSISATTTPVMEGTAAAFTLARTGATDAALTVDVSIAESGAAVSGAAPAEVTFAAESSTATLSVATEDDEVSEDASTVTATVSSGTGYTADGSSGSAEVVVNDDDAAPVVVTASPIEVAENGTPVATLAATDEDTAAENLSWSIPEVADGGADAAKFALTAAGVLTFKAAKDYESPDDANTDGDYEVTVRVTDGANPVDAALVVRLSELRQSTLAASEPVNTCGETGDDQSRCNDPEGVMITVSDAEVTEGPGATLDFVVTLSHAHSNADVTMDYEIDDSSESYGAVAEAVAGEDYTDARGTLRIPQGQTTGTISIAVLDDAESEGVERLELSLRNASKATFVRGFRGGRAYAQFRWSAVGTIIPDEDTTAPTVTVRAAEGVTAPVSGHFDIRVEFSELVEGLQASDLQVTNGAVASFTHTYRWGSTYQEKAWNATIVPDDGLNGNVSIQVTAGAVEDRLGNANTASNRFVIAARGASPNGRKPRLACETPLESNRHWPISVRAGFGSGFYAPEGFDHNDYALTTMDGRRAFGNRIFSCQGGGRLRSCEIVAEPLSGVSGTLVMRILAGAITDEAAGPSQASDPLYVAGDNWAVSVADATATEGTDGSLDFEVSLNGRDDCREVSVDWATADGTAVAGRDYTAASGTLTFAAGETTKTVSVAILNDTTSEGDETVTLQLSDVVGRAVAIGEAAATGTIQDGDDTAPTLSSATVDGDALSLVFDEALDGGSVPPASSFAVTVAGSARTVESVSVSGSAVTLTLASAVTSGETVTVGYTVPTGADSTPIEDAAGNAATAFADEEVTNETAANETPAAACPAPALSGGATLVWTGRLGIAKWPGNEYYGFGNGVRGTLDDRDFTLGSNDYLVDHVTQRGGSTGPLLFSLESGLSADEKRTLTLHVCEDGKQLRLSDASAPSRYHTYRWNRTGGLDWSTHAERTLHLVQDAAAPTLTAATVAGTSLVLTFGEALDEGSAPAASAFAVTVAGSARVVDAVDISASAVTLTLSSAVTAEDTVTVGYTVPAETETGLQDGSGNRVTSFADADVTNETAALPIVSTAAPAVTTASPIEVAENATAVATLTATDADTAAEDLTWSIPEGADGGADAAKFALTSAGVLTFRTAKDFEAPDDANTDGDYEVTVRVEDGTNQVDATMVVRLSDVLELLTASFAKTPESHDGSDAFEFEIHFSDEPKGLSYKTVRDALFDVANGTVTEAKRLTRGSNLAFVVKVEPTGQDDIEISTRGTESCDATHAVCAADGKMLLSGPSATVQYVSVAPISLSVADAEVEEGPGATLDFVVSLSRAADDDITVYYKAYDGTATAGADYEAVDSSFAFSPGQTEKTVSVVVLDDALDEGAETVNFSITAVRGLTAQQVVDPYATGTIRNTDKMPTAWIARFGRTVADHVIASVEARWEAAPTPGMEASLAGQRIGGPALPENVAEGQETVGGRSLSDWLNVRTEAHGQGFGSRIVTERDLLTGSSFAVTAQTKGSGLISTWGRGAVTRFDGRQGDLTLDGEVTSGMLGADWTEGAWKTGLVVTHSLGEGGYQGASAGTVTSTLTGIFPWAHHTLSEWLSVWGVGGYGEGSLVLEPEEQPKIRTDLDLWTAAAGLRGVLLDGGDDGPTLAAKTDAMIVQTSSDAVRGGIGNLAAAEAEVTRLRFGLEGSQPFRLAEGATLAPSAEIGVRLDGGDAETGFGVDIGGGLAWSDTARGITAEFRGRGLLTHEADGLRERGLSGSLSWDPTPASDRGPRASLTQTLGGSASGGMDVLLSRETLAGFAANDNEKDLQQRRLEARFGYGLAAFGDRFTSLPEFAVGLSDTGRDYSLGWRLVRGGAIGSGSLELSVEALRREPANDDVGREHQVGLRFNARF